MAKLILCELPQRICTLWHISQGRSAVERLQLNVCQVRQQSLWFCCCFLPRRPFREENSSGYSQHIYLQAETIEFLYVNTKSAGHKLAMAWKAEQNYSVLKQSKNSDFWAKKHWNAVLSRILRYLSHHIWYKKLFNVMIMSLVTFWLLKYSDTITAVIT